MKGSRFMLCQKCGKNPATTHIHTVVNGVTADADLCADCAKQYGYSKFSSNSLVDMLASMFGDAVQSGSALADTRCPCCHSSFSDIAEIGKVGCPECYKVFKNELLPYLKRVHGSTHHIGKRPNRPVPAVSVDDRLTRMRAHLNELIRNENFEEAAVVRDEIKKVEGEENHE